VRKVDYHKHRAWLHSPENRNKIVEESLSFSELVIDTVLHYEKFRKQKCLLNHVIFKLLFKVISHKIELMGRCYKFSVWPINWSQMIASDLLPFLPATDFSVE